MQSLSRVNVTGLYRKYLSLQNNKKNVEMSLKTGSAQIFSCCPKNFSCPKFGGLQPPSPPGPYAYEKATVSNGLRRHPRHLDGHRIEVLVVMFNFQYLAEFFRNQD